MTSVDESSMSSQVSFQQEDQSNEEHKEEAKNEIADLEGGETDSKNESN